LPPGPRLRYLPPIWLCIANGDKGGLFGKPQPYKAKLEARSPERAAIVRKEFAEAKTDVRSLADESNDGKLGTM
jgi:hypothetical protein